jgi:hypothetical protein
MCYNNDIYFLFNRKYKNILNSELIKLIAYFTTHNLTRKNYLSSYIIFFYLKRIKNFIL